MTFQFRVVEVFTDQFFLLHPRTLGFSYFSPEVFTPGTPAAYGESMVLEEDESEPVDSAATRFGAWYSAFAGLHAFLGAPDGSARAG